MEYIKRILFVIIVIMLLILFFHVFIFILLAGIIAYVIYKIYLKITGRKKRKKGKNHLRVNNVIMDAEYTEKK